MNNNILSVYFLVGCIDVNAEFFLLVVSLEQSVQRHRRQELAQQTSSITSAEDHVLFGAADVNQEIRKRQLDLPWQSLRRTIWLATAMAAQILTLLCLSARSPGQDLSNRR